MSHQADHAKENEDQYRCAQCGYMREALETRCPQCHSLNSMIDDILAREEAERRQRTLWGRLQAIIAAEDKRAEIERHWQGLLHSLPKRSFYVLSLIAIFVFALVISVM